MRDLPHRVVWLAIATTDRLRSVGFEVVDVTSWPVVSQESGGAEPKDWITSPERVGEVGREHLWLFKAAKTGEQPVRGGGVTEYRRHDDTSERVASALARLIGLPAAEVELARGTSDAGIISRNVTPDGWEIHSGDVILSEFPDYVPCSGDRRPKNRVGHNLANIRAVLGSCYGPPGVSEKWPAFDVFAGFLVFDAWIANTDRHAMNWAVLERSRERRLAPSFDHGSALGSGVPDETLPDDDVARFCTRGKASKFEGGAQTTLVGMAQAAVALAGAGAREWIDRLAAVRDDEVSRILSSVPTLSVRRSRFIFEVLRENRRRLTT